jgi:hypothetical protein
MISKKGLACHSRLVLGAALLISILAPSEASCDPLTIGIIGDQTKSSNLDSAYGVLQQGVDALNAESAAPDVILHTGDLVESTQSESDVARRFQQAVTILRALRSPWYLSAGDHDVNPPTYTQNSTDHSREELFRRLYAAVNPLASTRLYYSFDIKNWHIVALYSEEHLHTDPRWGNVYFAALSDQQQNWLSQDLAANAPGKDGVVVFLHQPLWYNWTGWARVHSLLAKYSVKAVIAGHMHYNQADMLLDGIQYWIVGSTGGDTKVGSENAGDLNHVATLKLDKGVVDFKLIPLSPFHQASWTSRDVMDRVQAISVVLGNMYNFDSNAKVFLEQGRLVGACGTTTGATIRITDIGNAIAEPVKVSIAIQSKSTRIASGAFGTGYCIGTAGPSSCTLIPSVGVALSNNSMVEIQTAPPLPPFWTAVIVPDNHTPPFSGDPIVITLSMSFTVGNQTYTTQTTSATAIKPCPVH